jgi:hypothetical protein
MQQSCTQKGDEIKDSEEIAESWHLTFFFAEATHRTDSTNYISSCLKHS